MFRCRPRQSVGHIEPAGWLPGAPDVLVVDLDGTLALPTTRRKDDPGAVAHDDVCDPVARLVRASGYPIVVVSARSESTREATEEWLTRYGIVAQEVLLARTGDLRSDVEIKRELYLTNLHGRVNVAAVFEDRAAVVDMWRSYGLLVFDVAGRK